MDNQFGLW